MYTFMSINGSSGSCHPRRDAELIPICNRLLTDLHVVRKMKCPLIRTVQNISNEHVFTFTNFKRNTKRWHYFICTTQHRNSHCRLKIYNENKSFLNILNIPTRSIVMYLYQIRMISCCVCKPCYVWICLEYSMYLLSL